MAERKRVRVNSFCAWCLKNSIINGYCNGCERNYSRKHKGKLVSTLELPRVDEGLPRHLAKIKRKKNKVYIPKWGF